MKSNLETLKDYWLTTSQTKLDYFKFKGFDLSDIEDFLDCESEEEALEKASLESLTFEEFINELENDYEINSIEELDFKEIEYLIQTYTWTNY